MYTYNLSSPFEQQHNTPEENCKYFKQRIMAVATEFFLFPASILKIRSKGTKSFFVCQLETPLEFHNKWSLVISLITGYHRNILQHTSYKHRSTNQRDGFGLFLTLEFRTKNTIA
jgi:hypothetical protein